MNDIDKKLIEILNKKREKEVPEYFGDDLKPYKFNNMDITMDVSNHFVDSTIYAMMEPKKDYRTEFSLLYAKISEIKLRMEKVIASNSDVDFEYQYNHYNEWIKQISK